MTQNYIKNFFKNPWDEGEDVKKPFKPMDNNANKFQNPFESLDLNNKDLHKFTILVVILIFFFWLATGFFKVQDGSQGVVQRFGQYVRSSYPGLNYHIPYPFEKVTIENVALNRRLEIGFRSASNNSTFGSLNSSIVSEQVAAESIMLTGDENIVDISCVVMWRIKDIKKYIFKIAEQEVAVRTASESAIREVIGKNPIAYAQTTGKEKIAADIMSLIQSILDKYGAGIVIDEVQLLKVDPPAEVIDSFRDVQTSKADKESAINQARAYSNDVLPKARGTAAKIIESAKAFKQERINAAQGEAERYLAILKEYKKNKNITKNRMYLDTVTKILQFSEKTIVPAEGVLPHLSVAQKSEMKSNKTMANKMLENKNAN